MDTKYTCDNALKEVNTLIELFRARKSGLSFKTVEYIKELLELSTYYGKEKDWESCFQVCAKMRELMLGDVRSAN